MTIIIEARGKSVVPAIRGYAMAIKDSKKRKYSGKFDDMTRMIDWDTCVSAFDAIVARYHENFSPNAKIEYTSEGLSGPYKAMSRRLHGGVELTLSYHSENHLASADAVNRTLYPGNHGQAVRHMVIQDIIEQAKSEGPFTSEEVLLSFIKDRSELHFQSLGQAKPASYCEDSTPEVSEEAP